MRRTTIGLTAAAVAVVGTVAVAGAAMANAASDSAATPSPSATASTSPGDRGTCDGPGASRDTAVTGAEADRVVAAVTAKDAAATIDTVRKDPDGSYDALGTKDGSPVRYDVSADLKTVTEHTGDPGGGRGLGGRAPDRGSASGSSSGSSADSDPTAANTAYAV